MRLVDQLPGRFELPQRASPGMAEGPYRDRIWAWLCPVCDCFEELGWNDSRVAGRCVSFFRENVTTQSQHGPLEQDVLPAWVRVGTVAQL